MPIKLGLNFKIPKLAAKKRHTGDTFSSKNTKPDSFETTPINVTTEGYTVKCRPVKKVLLKDSKGCSTEALIARHDVIKNQYFVLKDDEVLCRMFFGDNENSLYIYDLKGKNNDGKFKGAGSELVKIAINESIKKGYDGKLSICMAASLPFYFKCNFRAPSQDPSSPRKNAFMDYMTRHPEIDANSFSANGWGMPNGVCLDENGAKAMLLNERFLDNSKSKTLYAKDFIDEDGNVIKTNVDFCDFSNDPSTKSNNIIQIINDQYAPPQLAFLDFEPDGRGDIKIKKEKIRAWDLKLKKELEQELLKAAKNIIQEF